MSELSEYIKTQEHLDNVAFLSQRIIDVSVATQKIFPHLYNSSDFIAGAVVALTLKTIAEKSAKTNKPGEGEQ